MRIVCNRFNPQKLIEVLEKHAFFGGTVCSMRLDARWQVSVSDDRGRCYDHCFVAKPTRKQIRKLHKVRKHYLPRKCYECGKRIKLGDEFSWDDLNYAHANCIGAKK